MTFMTIPSTISGGPSIFQVRLSSGEVLTSGDEADVLMAFYQHSYDNHIDFVKEGGIVLYDTAHVEPRDDLKENSAILAVRLPSLPWKPSAARPRIRAKIFCTRLGRAHV